MEEMQLVHFRLTTVEKEKLKAKSIVEQRSMSVIIREAVSRELDTRPIEQIRAALAQARSHGPVSEKAALGMARSVAEAEVEAFPEFGEGSDEGFGEVRIIRGE